MPSTGWNVFVASVVALVVYIAVRAEMVLLGLIAGTLTFVVGWLLGYAINEDLLDSMELSRVVGAGGVTVFAIVWTLLYSDQAYLLGLIVVCLAWFAAWFTSSMGPIKGDTGAMATIDEPRPPAGSEPGEPLDLGGPADTGGDSDGGFFSRLFGFGTDDARSPPGYAAEDAARAPDDGYVSQEADEPSRATTEPTRTTSADTGSSAESIFGLGIFYEGDPTEPSAGADDDGYPASPDAESDGTTEPSGTASAPAEPEAPPEQGAEPAAADHTRPSATGPVHRDPEVRTEPADTESAAEKSPIDEAALDPSGEESRAGRERRESSRRSDATPEQGTEAAAPEAYKTYRGDTGEGAADATDEPAGDADDGDEPPEDHRVDVDDDDGFIFG